MHRAFDLLALLGKQPHAATLSELARASDLPVSTVARLLGTLEHADFVRRTDAGSYAPGGGLLRIGLAAVQGLSIYEISEPHLRRLCEASGETANIAVRTSAENAVYLRQVVSPRSIHHAAWLGRSLPLERTAIGHALTGRVNARGFTVKRDALEPDVTAIAAPVVSADGAIVAAFSITGPTYRISEKHLERFGLLVVAEARLASAKLGAPTRV